MSASRKTLAMRELGRLFRSGALPSEDGALLASFIADGDELAFEALVERHGSMVLGVCRRLLGDSHDADDAFQATFLVLVRKAGQIRDSARLGPWLYGVATRVASKSRARELKRRGRLKAVPPDFPAPANGEREFFELRSIVDAELGKLSPKLREILVLCLLEGRTAEEASHQLACPVGTVRSRLARGREALRGGLTGRGILPAAALAVVAGTAPSALASPVSRTLTLSTVRIATLAPERIPLAVVALTKGIKTSMLHKSTVFAALVCGGLAVAGAGVFAWQKSHAGPLEPQAQSEKQNTDPARQKSIRNFREVLLAFHNFHSANGHFPPAAIYGADGEPKLSWRVAILPFLGEQALYQEFELNEPWDSPHNKALIARMPDVFTMPSSPTPPGTTRIRGFSGPNTFFRDRTGIEIASITDGTSNTAAIVAASDATTWTRPGEVPFLPGQVRAVLDNSDEHGVLVGPVDGSARFISGTSEAIWRFFITPAGNEVLRMEAFASWPANSTEPASRPAKLPPPTATPMPTSPVNVTPVAPAPAISPDLEARLRAIEAKLDRLMRKLDGDDSARTPR
jgi:RNA polymerase sigma factor (sigma-70 family)